MCSLENCLCISVYICITGCIMCLRHILISIVSTITVLNSRTAPMILPLARTKMSHLTIVSILPLIALARKQTVTPLQGWTCTALSRSPWTPLYGLTCTALSWSPWTPLHCLTCTALSRSPWTPLYGLTCTALSRSPWTPLYGLTCTALSRSPSTAQLPLTV